MEPTSEAGLVAAIDRAVRKEWPEAWIFKVVGSPFQMTGVPDLLICIEGRLFAPEVKHRKPGESVAATRARATPRQLAQIQLLQQAGAWAGVVISVEEVVEAIRDVLRPKQWIVVQEPEIGDRATHRRGDLDPREVLGVDDSEAPVLVFLKVGRHPAGPYPASNYIFERYMRQES